VLLGRERYRYGPSHYLLASAGLPLAGHIIEASKERPYLAVRLVPDPAVVTAVLIEAGPRAGSSLRGWSVIVDRPSSVDRRQ
jgi:hypothetical protein